MTFQKGNNFPVKSNDQRHFIFISHAKCLKPSASSLWHFMFPCSVSLVASSAPEAGWGFNPSLRALFEHCLLTLMGGCPCSHLLFVLSWSYFGYSGGEMGASAHTFPHVPALSPGHCCCPSHTHQRLGNQKFLQHPRWSRASGAEIAARGVFATGMTLQRGSHKTKPWQTTLGWVRKEGATHNTETTNHIADFCLSSSELIATYLQQVPGSWGDLTT